MMHLNRFTFSRNSNGGELKDHTGLDNTGLNTSDGNSSNTTDLVDILERKSERLVSRSLRGYHVVANESRDRNEWNSIILGLITNLLDVTSYFVLDFLITSFFVLSSIHLVDTDNHLLNSKSES